MNMSGRLTKKLALEIAIELWTWMSKTGSEYKNQWPKWKKYGYMSSHCPLCEFAEQAAMRAYGYGEEAMCDFCPIMRWGDGELRSFCLDEGSAFRGWNDTRYEGKKAASKAACEVLKVLKSPSRRYYISGGKRVYGLRG